VNRIDIVYDGKPYSLGGRSLESLQGEVGAAIASGFPYWMKVNSGEGRYADAYLLIAPGIPLAMVHVKPNGEGPEADTAAPADFMLEML
jgi:hypothetical protein